MDLSFLSSKEFIGFIGVILGYLLSWIKDYFIENKKQKEKEKQFKRDKLEKVFILLSREAQVMGDNFSRVVNKDSKLVSFDNAELAMIVRFYFEDIESKYQVHRKIYSDFKLKMLDSTNQINVNDWKQYLDSYKSMVDLLVLISREF